MRNILIIRFPITWPLNYETGFRNETVKPAKPEVTFVRTPDVHQHSSASDAIERITNGNHVNKGSAVVISQNGFYSSGSSNGGGGGFTDMPPKEFGHDSGKGRIHIKYSRDSSG